MSREQKRYGEIVVNPIKTRALRDALLMALGLLGVLSSVDSVYLGMDSTLVLSRDRG